jgi:hypothetical protein
MKRRAIGLSVSASGIGSVRGGGERAARRARAFHDAHGTHSSTRPIFSPARVDGLAVSSRSSAAGAPDKTRQSLDSAPPGHDSEQHFGSPRRVPGLVDGDAIAAGERELEPAAQAEALDQRERRYFTFARRSNGVPSPAHDGHRAAASLHFAELVDVAPAMKPFGLPERMTSPSAPRGRIDRAPR